MMDALYAGWPTAAPVTSDRPGPRPIDTTEAFSFGEPPRGVRASRQEWAPALDLFDIDRSGDVPPAPLALAKLVGLVLCLTGFAGVLLGTVWRLVLGAFSGTPGS
jgi:hypothetical protein